MHPFYEPLTKNNLCPFCKIKMETKNESAILLGYWEHHHCDHCDFMRFMSDVDSIGFNIKLTNDFNIQGGELWESDNELHIWKHGKLEDESDYINIYAPIFDVFSYSLAQLDQKIKTLLIFQ